MFLLNKFYMCGLPSDVPNFFFKAVSTDWTKCPVLISNCLNQNNFCINFSLKVLGIQFKKKMH